MEDTCLKYLTIILKTYYILNKYVGSKIISENIFFVKIIQNKENIIPFIKLVFLVFYFDLVLLHVMSIHYPVPNAH